MRTVVATIVAVIVLAVLVGAAFVYSGSYYVRADQPHWSVTAWLLNEARHRSIRVHASGITVPTGLDNPANILTGVSHYSEHCVVCHGAPGVERGEIAEGLYPRPPNLGDAARFYTADELFWIVKHGIRMTGMPSWGDHSDDELWATVAFIERLPGMSDGDYEKLFVASRAQGGHHHEQERQQEQARQPAEKNYEHPATSTAAEQPAGANHDQSTGKGHDHPAGHHHH